MTTSSARNFYIVGIGTSAGGLEALEKFFANVPPNSDMAYVVIQHLSPDYKSHMVELLSKYTTLAMYEAQDGMMVEPNAIYLIPRRKNMTIYKGKLFLIDSVRNRGLNLPIDLFFVSLATDQGERAVGVILSGTGSDGTRGIRAIKEAGGLVLAQDDSARFDGMPRSAISTELVDFILPPEQMPGNLLNYIQHPCLATDPAIKPPIATDSDLMDRLFMLLRSSNGVDFSDYKPNTIIRRIERRMSVNQLDTLANYVSYLEESPHERRVLFKEFLIGVTRFFRDPDIFAKFQDEIIPAISNTKLRQDQVRVWVAGCATGEEAYSLAILFREYMEKSGRYSDVKIFATDIDNDALEFASQGVYSESIVGDVSPERLRNFFIKKGDTYEVLRQIRSMVVFANQNLVKDPPFSKMDLISCRNLLIYLQPKLQERALATFQFALSPGGYLCLGTSETVGEYGDIFLPLDNKTKIFRYDGGSRPRLDYMHLSDRATDKSSLGVTPYRQQTFNRSDDWRSSDPVLRSLVEQLIPPCVVVDENHTIVHMFGELGDYIGLPQGYRIDWNILRMVRDPLTLPLTTALHRAAQDNEDVLYKNIKLPENDPPQEVDLGVRLFFEKNQRQRLFLVTFLPARPTSVADEPGETFNLSKSMTQRISVLEQELQYTRENLQATIEELETANEELQATNEELMAANEELQSTNEELQSVNEELITVNNEYQAKIQELTDLNDDVNNLFKSIEVGTIFLDADLHLRKFTPAAQIDINLLEQDIGRPIGHLTHNLKQVDLLELVQHVLDHLTPLEREVQSSTGNWYMLKVIPYRTFTNQIEGVVITLVNINKLKRAQLQLADLGLARNYLDAMGGLVVALDRQERVAFINHLGSQLLGCTPEELLGQNWFETCLPPAAREQTRAAFVDLLAGKLDEGMQAENLVITRSGEERLIAWENTVLRDEAGNIVGTLGSGTDITEWRRVGDAIKFSQQRLADILAIAGITAFQQDTDLRYTWIQNPLIFTPEEMVGATDRELLPHTDTTELVTLKQSVLDNGQDVRQIITLSINEKAVTFDLALTPQRDELGQIIGLNGLILANPRHNMN